MSARSLTALFLAEMIGTYMIVVFGDGSIATYVVSKREVDVFAASMAFGVGAMIGTFVAAKISGAHVNPAVTLAFACDGRTKWRLVPVYICAQYLGGLLAALTLMVTYWEAIRSLDGGKLSAYGSSNSSGHIFATYPAAWLSVWGSIVDQTVATGVMVFSLCAITDKNNAGLEGRHQPLYIALVVGFSCLTFAPNCGAILNPARDLAPRLLTYIFGYSSPSVWSPLEGLYWLSGGVVGPHLGAILGTLGYRLLIAGSLRHSSDYELEDIDKRKHAVTSKFAHRGHQDTAQEYGP